MKETIEDLNYSVLQAIKKNLEIIEKQLKEVEQWLLSEIDCSDLEQVCNLLYRATKILEQYTQTKEVKE